MRIILAGPMRGYPGYNFKAFDRAARLLRARGHEVINPAEEFLKEGFDPNSPLPDDREFVVRATLARLADLGKADAVCMLRGWRKSSGATLERDFAKCVGIPIFTLAALLNLPPSVRE